LLLLVQLVSRAIESNSWKEADQVYTQQSHPSVIFDRSDPRRLQTSSSSTLSSPLAGAAAKLTSAFADLKAAATKAVGQQSPVAAAPIPSDADIPTVLVYFVGGVTRAEVSALRFWARQHRGICRVLIATTQTMNGTSLIKQLVVGSSVPCSF
jgi:hypothetical protein